MTSFNEKSAVVASIITGPRAGIAARPHAPRLRELDSIRGIAALWVALFHLSFGVGHWYPTDPATAARLRPFATNIQGLLAVDMFFMISGFVILMTLENTRSVKQFAIARCARLYPAYWVCLAITTAIAIALPSPVQPVTLLQVLANITMFNEYARLQPIDPSYWSLAVELGFYIMMASLFACRQLHRIELYGALWIALSALAFKLAPAIGALIPWRVQVFSGLPWAPLFFGGILLFRMRQHGPSATRLALLLACLIIRTAGNHLPYALGTVAVFTLCACTAAGWLPVLRFRPLAILGAISYPLYLLHQSNGFRIQQIAVLHLGASAMGGFLLAVTLCLLLAATVTYTIERSGQRWMKAVLTGNNANHPGH